MESEKLTIKETLVGFAIVVPLLFIGAAMLNSYQPTVKNYVPQIPLCDTDMSCRGLL